MPKSFTEIYEHMLERDNLSEFEHDVYTRALQNGSILAEDYEEAFNRFLTCMARGGINPGYHVENGIHTRNSKMTQEEMEIPDDYWQKLDSECHEGNFISIEGNYRLQISNPQLLSNSYQVAINCIHEKGEDIGDFTADELKNDLDKLKQSKFDFTDFSLDLTNDNIQICLKSIGIALNVD